MRQLRRPQGLAVFLVDAMGVGGPQEIDPALVDTGGAGSGSLFELPGRAVFPGSPAILEVDAEEDITCGIERCWNGSQGALPHFFGDVVFFEPGLEALLGGELMVLDSVKFFEDSERDRIRSCLQPPGDNAFPALVLFSQVLLDPGIDAVFESPPQ